LNKEVSFCNSEDEDITVEDRLAFLMPADKIKRLIDDMKL
jgi:hypothetical protein